MISGGSCVAYCADLSPYDMETVLRIMLNPRLQSNRSSTLLSLSQNRFMMCQSPFSARFEKDISKKGAEYSNTSDVKKMFTEQRKVTVLLTEGKSVLLKQKELMALAESKVKRSIISKKMVLRRLDGNSAVKLLMGNESKRRTGDDSHNRNKNQRHDQSPVKRTCNARSNVIRIAPRDVHRQEPEESLEYRVTPHDKEIFNKPSFPVQRENSEEKVPIQATTDVEQDCPSIQMAINAPSALTSYYETSLPPRYSFTRNSANSAEYAASRQDSGQPSNISRDSTFLNPSPPRYQDYMTSAQRLSSFQTGRWLINEKPDVSTLVDQGFFYTGRDDLVRCFHCGIGLKDWVKDDDVVKEHVKYSSSCTYLLQKVSRLQLERIKFEVASGNESLSSHSSTTSGSQPTYRIRTPKYQTMEARLASFKSYPSSIGIRTQLLAVAGLYYTGQGDLCRCFACDGGLKDWSAGDDPCREHATYFPQCGYINQLKGSDYVRARQRERETNAQEGAAGGYSQNPSDTYTPTLQSMGKLSITNISTDQSELTVTEVVQNMGYSEVDVVTAKAELERNGDINPTADKVINAILDIKEKSSNGAPVATCTQEDDLQAIAEENERLTEVIQCMLCVTEEPDILFLPCAHHRVCHGCAQKITHCPKCNTRIKERIRTYRA